MRQASTLERGRCGDEWDASGVESNQKKAEDGMDCTEVQGLEARAHQRTVGVSIAQRMLLFQQVLG